MIDLAVVLAVALGLGLVVTRLHLPPLLGFLATGFVLIVVGDDPPEGLETIAELGVTLLLFSIGLKINPATLVRREVWLTAATHMVFSIALAGSLLLGLAALGVAAVAGEELTTILLVAFALSFSSTVLVVKLLETVGREQSLFGRIAVGILVMQDIAAVVFLSISRGAPPSPWALVLIGLVPLAWLLHRVLDHISHGELLIVFGTTCALLPGYVLFEAVGIKGDLGALILGIILGRHPRAHELSSGMWSVKDLLLVGFFVSIGYSINGAIDGRHIAIALILTLLIPVQALAYAVILRRQGLRTRTATLGALSLANNSEFALIVTAAGVASGLLDQGWLIIMVLAVAFSFVLSTLANQRSAAISEWAVDRFPDPPDDRLHVDDRPIDIGSADVIILGMGRAGLSAYDRLVDAYGLHPVGIEIDADRTDYVRRFGVNAIAGDATDADFWERCQQHPDVRLAILAMPLPESNYAALEQLQARGFAGTVAAISRFDDAREEILRRGADVAIQVYEGAGQRLADRAVSAAGLDERDAGSTDGG